MRRATSLFSVMIAAGFAYGVCSSQSYASPYLHAQEKPTGAISGGAQQPTPFPFYPPPQRKKPRPAEDNPHAVGPKKIPSGSPPPLDREQLSTPLLTQPSSLEYTLKTFPWYREASTLTIGHQMTVSGYLAGPDAILSQRAAGHYLSSSTEELRMDIQQLGVKDSVYLWQVCQDMMTNVSMRFDNLVVYVEESAAYFDDPKAMLPEKPMQDARFLECTLPPLRSLIESLAAATDAKHPLISSKPQKERAMIYPSPLLALQAFRESVVERWVAWKPSRDLPKEVKK